MESRTTKQGERSSSNNNTDTKIQLKVNLHNTRNVELKNQDISEDNNQITEGYPVHFMN